jgi:hypothetical protein
VRRIDRATALRLLEDLADYAASGHGDVERLTDIEPPELRLRVGDYASASTTTVSGSKFSVWFIGERPTGKLRALPAGKAEKVR